MCGIVGYIGTRDAYPVLIKGLKRLEYRGYDSCGIAVRGSNIRVFKDAYRVCAMKNELPPIKGTIGIGHTRWATHGGVTKENAHPHISSDKKIALLFIR